MVCPADAEDTLVLLDAKVSPRRVSRAAASEHARASIGPDAMLQLRGARPYDLADAANRLFGDYGMGMGAMPGGMMGGMGTMMGGYGMGMGMPFGY